MREIENKNIKEKCYMELFGPQNLVQLTIHL